MIPNFPSPCSRTASPEPRDKVIAIAGPSGSGKTELICRLLEWFGVQGLRVAVLKHTHKQNLGESGKDTGRYRQFGAGLVALVGPGFLQITRVYAEEPPLAAALAELAPEVDLILVEGYKSGSLPKLALVGQETGHRLPDYPHIIALVSGAPLAAEVPVFQPHQVEEICRFILEYLGIAP